MRAFAAPALIAFASVGVLAHEGHHHDEPPAAAKVEEAPKLTHTFVPTTVKGVFLEQFTDDWEKRWTPSEATKKTPVGGETFSYVGKWSVEESSVLPAIAGDKGLVAKTKAAHHAISAPFTKPLDFSEKPLVVQYEVKYQKGGNCGGGYLKLLEDGFQTSGKEFSDKTPWVVMFGPDLTCPGTKVHFIFRHKNPKTGEYEEKHLKTPPTPAINTKTILYTLILNPDSTYEVLINDESSKKGSLLEDFTPPVNPEKEIDDPKDSKPETWVDEAKIADPEATKPADWDEEAPYEILDEEAVQPEGWLEDEAQTVPDPEAEKPAEWDDEEDGDWIAPSVPNPKCKEAPGCGKWTKPYKPNPEYKGKWYAPQIDNPAYKGEWKPRKIDNPDYFEDKTPAKSLNNIGGVGIELWTMTEDILFDNIYVGHSPAAAKTLAKETFHIKQEVEKEADAPIPDPDEVHDKTFKEDPLGFLRLQVFSFIELARIDPLLAFKSKPETAAGLIAIVFTLFGMFGAVFGLVGSSSKPVTRSAKKSDAPTPDDKKPAKEVAPVAPAGNGEKAKDAAPAKKRK